MRDVSQISWVPSLKIRPERVILHIVLMGGALLILFPVVWMAVSTFKSESEIAAFPPTFFPKQPTLQPLIDAWTKINLRRSFLNSLLVACVLTPLNVLTSVWVGFVLAKYEFRGKDLMFYAIVATRMIPGTVLLIPHYQVALWLGLINNYGALILPGIFAAFGIFLMRQAMHSVPNELLDAARMDGASEPHIFLQIAVPLVKPVLAALAIFQFLGSWDSFLWPLIVLTKERMYTLPVSLALFAGGYERNISPRNAGAFITIFPVVLVYVFFQRHIVQSIALTGIKG